METGEVIGCLFCMFVLSLSTVLCAKIIVRFQDHIKIVKFILFTVWVLIADETGQGMVALAGAVRGEPKAEAQLGFHYLTGHMLGTFKSWQLYWPQNTERGQYWLDKASESGNPAAEAILAQAYLDGDMGLPKDGMQAVNYLRRIVDNPKVDSDTKAEAALNLYILYKEGQLGVPQDPVVALRFCSTAADEGNPDAEYAMGKAYEAGEYVPVDYGKAFAYYEASVKNGNPGALADLARVKEQMGAR